MNGIQHTESISSEASAYTSYALLHLYAAGKIVLTNQKMVEL